MVFVNNRAVTTKHQTKKTSTAYACAYFVTPSSYKFFSPKLSQPMVAYFKRSHIFY